MPKKQKIHSSTQDFTEIVEISDGVAYFKGRRACTVLEISSVNFFLLSQDEQNARVYGYMSLLNSLSFFIQILVVSKRVDMSGYLKLLDQKITSAQNPKISQHLEQYRVFMQELIKGEDLLDKKTYIIIPISFIEMGAGAAVKSNKGGFSEQAKEALISKRNTVISQIERIGLTAKPLGNDEMISLFYEQFNQEIINTDFNSDDLKNIVL